MGSSHPASILLHTRSRRRRRWAMAPSRCCRKIQTVEKRLRTRQTAVEASTAKRETSSFPGQAARSSHALTGAGGRVHGRRRRCNGGRTVETDVLGRYDLVDEENTQAGWPCLPRDSNSSWPGADQVLPRAAKPHSGIYWCNGTLRSTLARAPTATGCSFMCNMSCKICSLRWQFSHEPPAIWSWLKSWRKSVDGGSYVELGAILFQALLVRCDLRTLANTRHGGVSWPPRHSLTSLRRFEHIQFPYL